MLIEVLCERIGRINLVQDLRVFLYTRNKTGLKWFRILMCFSIHGSKLD